MTTVTESAIEGLKLANRGKVRDIYDLGDEIAVVTSDRISAFDVVLPNGIPEKGKVLTQISVYWFDLLEREMGLKHHLKGYEWPDVKAALERAGAKNPSEQMLAHRTMIVHKADVFPVECVVRGYITGSGWKSYKRCGEVSGIELPEGLVECQKLEEPLFTPTTKADVGHDEEISFDAVVNTVGSDTAERLRELSLKVYNAGRDYAEKKGIILADTKFEWGALDGEIILVDEVLTPDSSRFWPGETYEAGRSQPSFDKQFVRDYLETLDWDKTPETVPTLPEDVVAKTSEKYLEIYRKLTGKNPGWL